MWSEKTCDALVNTLNSMFVLSEDFNQWYTAPKLIGLLNEIDEDRITITDGWQKVDVVTDLILICAILHKQYRVPQSLNKVRIMVGAMAALIDEKPDESPTLVTLYHANTHTYECPDDLKVHVPEFIRGRRNHYWLFKEPMSDKDRWQVMDQSSRWVQPAVIGWYTFETRKPFDVMLLPAMKDWSGKNGHFFTLKRDGKGWLFVKDYGDYIKIKGEMRSVITVGDAPVQVIGTQKHSYCTQCRSIHRGFHPHRP